MNNRVIRCYQPSWKCKFATISSLNADASSISTLSAFKFFINSVDKLSCYTLPPMLHHSFATNLTPLFIVNNTTSF